MTWYTVQETYSWVWLDDMTSQNRKKCRKISTFLNILGSKTICLKCTFDRCTWIVCQAVTSQTSSIATTVSRNSSNPSLWCGVVNLQKRYNPVIHSHSFLVVLRSQPERDTIEPCCIQSNLV